MPVEEINRLRSAYQSVWSKKESVCVCVFVCVLVCVRERKSVCVRERKRVCVREGCLSIIPFKNWVVKLEINY